MVGRIIPPLEDVHSLIFRTYEYITLQDKRDFAEAIKVKDLEMGKLSMVICRGPRF